VLCQLPNVRGWSDVLKTRPGLRKGCECGKEPGRPGDIWDKEARKNLMPAASVISS
jgi:GST-like protein